MTTSLLNFFALHSLPSTLRIQIVRMSALRILVPIKRVIDYAVSSSNSLAPDSRDS